MIIKSIIISLVAALTALVTLLTSQQNLLKVGGASSLDANQNPSSLIAVPTSATTTKNVGTKHTYTFDSPFANQGTCLKYKDSDSSGFTYVTYNNGVQTVSQNSCE